MITRRKACVHTIIFCLAFIFMVASQARADICILKTGDYSGTTPCDTKDSADGSTDQIVNLSYTVGEDIDIDVVYEQEATKYRMELFSYFLFYDTANMTQTITCTPDPSNYFRDNMSGQLGIQPCWGSEGNYAQTQSGIRIIEQAYMNFNGDNFPAEGSEPDTFIMDQISFQNDSYVAYDTYEYFEFTSYGGQLTDMGAISVYNERCPLINLGLQCNSLGITTAQKLLKAKVTINPLQCYVGTPAVPSPPSCDGLDGCTMTTGQAQFDINYTLPTTCYADQTCSTTSTLCSNSQVAISDGTNTYIESDGTYSETRNIGDVVSGYTVYGVDDNCFPSSALNCPGVEDGTISIDATTCNCGDPPEISLTNSSYYGSGGSGAWYEGQIIKVDFTLTDPDADEGSGLPDSVPSIKFYFSDDSGSTTTVYDVNSDVATALNSSGAFSARIYGGYNGSSTVDVGQDIYFAVVATDEDTMIGTYPADLTCPGDICDWSDPSKYVLISGSKIVEDTSPPTPVTTVRDGLVYDIDTSNSQTDLSANWNSTSDAHSGKVIYYYALGTTAGGNDVIDWTSTQFNTTISRTDLSLTLNQAYYFSVKAENYSGYASTATTSDGVTITPVIIPETITLLDEWNLVGASANNVTLDTATLFPSAAFEVVKYANGQLTFLTNPTSVPLDIGAGYWVYSQTNHGSISLSGASEFTGASKDISLTDGWNIIANPYDQQISWSDTNATLSCGALPPLYEFTSGYYTRIAPNNGESILPWQGYFIKVTGTCTLTISQ